MFAVQYNMSKAWLLVLVTLYNCFPTKGINNIPARPSTVNIGAILSFNSTIGRVAKVAIEAAVDDINSNSSVLNGTMLKISMQDTKLSSGFLGIIDCTSLSNTSDFSTSHFARFSLETYPLPLLLCHVDFFFFFKQHYC